MENLNAEEIKNGLECCADANSCYDGKCPYKSDILTACTTKMSRDALALIKSQEQRIEAYRQALGEARVALAEKAIIFVEMEKQLERLNNENERLKGIYESYMLQYGTVTDKEVFLKQERANTVWKMQERLKGRFNIRKDALYPETTIHEVIDLIAEYILEEG